MIIQSIKFQWKPGAEEKLEKFKDRVVYDVAYNTLQYSNPIIPKDTKTLILDTFDYGVKGSNCSYTIGSPTSYAKYVWNYDDATTHWTVPGTGNQWFIKGLKKYGKVILQQATERNKLK